MKYSTKKGVDNVVADALSRVQGAEILCMAISLTTSDLSILITASYELDAHLKDIIIKLHNNETISHYQWQHDLLRRKGKIVMGPDDNLKAKILNWNHASVEGWHSGSELTLRRVKAIFYWKGLSKSVKQFVRQCQVCQVSKSESIASPGLLQPLLIPEEVWSDISMDFITGLPKSGGKDVIFVVVDRLSKYSHFMALSHPFTAVDVA